MNAIFADSFYYLAIVSRDDTAHSRAVAVSRQLKAPIVTTAWILTEVADALAAPRQRRIVSLLIDSLTTDARVTIIPPSQGLFDQGLTLYESRPDKEWSLTDCISFVVMQQMQLRDALTGDHHFEQAGFKALLR
jgi:predicted nucleic acid-binding protein